MKMIKPVILAALALAVSIGTASADEKYRPNISAGWSYSNVTNTDGLASQFIDRNGHSSYFIQVGFDTHPGGEFDAFQEILNYPTFGLGAAFDNHSSMQFKNNSRLGDFVDLYAFMEGAFYKHKYFSIGYFANFGVGFTGVMYDRYTNPLEINIGAPISVYMAFGPQVKLRPADHVELILNANWHHHSTGNTWMPNWGLNDMALGAELRYDIDKPYTEQVRKLTREHVFEKKMHYDIYATYGVQASKTEFKAYNLAVENPDEKQVSFTSRPRVSLGFDAMYRYCLLCSTGIAIDCVYAPYCDILRACDVKLHGEKAVEEGPGYSPFVCSLGFAHEFHYGNVSAYCGASYYLLRKAGIEDDHGKFFQRAGMRFHFSKWKNTFLGWCIRATQFCNADYFEFQFGIRI